MEPAELIAALTDNAWTDEARAAAIEARKRKAQQSGGLVVSPDDSALGRADRIYGGSTALAVGAGLVHGSVDRLTGLQTVYHGTLKENRPSILSRGLMPKFGGTGGSVTEGYEPWIKQSQGKVHVSTSKAEASGYGKAIYGAKVKKPGTVIKAKISYKDFQKFKTDQTMFNDSAFTTTKRIRPAQIMGGNAPIKQKIIQRTSDMLKGLKASPVRVLKGAGMLAGGLFAGAVGVDQLIKAFRKKGPSPTNNSTGDLVQVINGGPGSGNHGHKGIPGHRGGSAPSNGGAPSSTRGVSTSVAGILRLAEKSLDVELQKGAPLSTEEKDRNRRREYTKTARLSVVLADHADELEKKYRSKWLPVSGQENARIAQAHAVAAEALRTATVQSTTVLGASREEQQARMAEADKHQKLADEHFRRAGTKGYVKKLSKTAAGTAFRAALGGTPEEVAASVGAAIGTTARESAKEGIQTSIGAAVSGVQERGKKLEQPLVEAEKKIAKKNLKGGAANLVKGQARTRQEQLAESPEFIKESGWSAITKKALAAGGEAAKAIAKERAKKLYTKQPKETPEQLQEKALADAKIGVEYLAAERAKLAALEERVYGKPGSLSRKEKSIVAKARNEAAAAQRAAEKTAEETKKEIEDLKSGIAAIQKLLAPTQKNNADHSDRYEEIVVNLSSTGQVRREKVNGRDYYVAPLTMIVPGVLHGSRGALYYPEDELKKNPSSWDGMPIVVNHPMKNGVAVKANDPEILDKFQIGHVSNASYNGKLVAEGWFDVQKTRRINSGILNSLQSGKPIELSTGLFTDNDPIPGTYNGRSYQFVARNYRPDHLAILIGQRGACSVSDGCGVLVNAKTEKPNPVVANIIRKLSEDKYRLYSHKGKNLGTCPTRACAKKRERQVEYFKHVKA